MGGSLGMALKRHHLAREVVGWSRRPATLRRAKRRGAIDRGTTNLKDAVQGAQLVVLATPVETIVPLARRVARWMRAGSVLTDVGSAKGEIVQRLERALPSRVTFVGAHPLAGSEQQRIAAARADLFDGSLCIVTATRQTNRRALQAVLRTWKPLARRVVIMDPRAHDRLLAATSHLAHLLAFSLMGATSDAALAVAPRSFLDATRVAKSDPELWDDIFFTNRAALLAALDRFEREWQRVRRALTRGDRAALRRLLRRARVKRYALRDC